MRISHKKRYLFLGVAAIALSIASIIYRTQGSPSQYLASSLVQDSAFHFHAYSFKGQPLKDVCEIGCFTAPPSWDSAGYPLYFAKAAPYYPPAGIAIGVYLEGVDIYPVAFIANAGMIFLFLLIMNTSILYLAKILRKRHKSVLERASIATAVVIALVMIIHFAFLYRARNAVYLPPGPCTSEKPNC